MGRGGSEGIRENPREDDDTHRPVSDLRSRRRIWSWERDRYGLIRDGLSVF